MGSRGTLWYTGGRPPLSRLGTFSSSATLDSVLGCARWSEARRPRFGMVTIN